VIIDNLNDIQQVLDFILTNDKLAFDVETTGLDVRNDEIIGFGISNGEKGYYVCHQEFDTKFPSGGMLIKKLSKDVCATVLRGLAGKKLITWNGSFDLRFTFNYFDVDLIGSLWCEGMLTKHTVDEEMPFRLKDVAKKLYGIEAAEEQTIMKASIKSNGGTVNQYFKADLDIMGKYCIKDCLLTFRINEHYLAKLKSEGLEQFYFVDEVMPLYREVTIPMELKGVPIDVAGFEKLHKEISIDIERLENEIQWEIKDQLDVFEKWFLWKDFAPKRTGLFGQYTAKYFNLNLPKTKTGKFSLAAKEVEALPDSVAKRFLMKEGILSNEDIKAIQMLWWEENKETKYMFSLQSKHHLKKLFFDTLGEIPLTKTDKGNPQCNDDFLDEMAKKYPWVDKLRDFNKLALKLRGTYIERFLDRHDNGIFYPSFFQHRTISGRYGSDLQQLPRQKEEGELSPLVLRYSNAIRELFIAGDGYKFIDADYESLEPHVFAHVSGDEKLKDIFRKGHDFYSTIAIDMEQLENVSADKKAENYLGKVNKPVRQAAKPPSLGIPYGMEEYALSLILGISRGEAAKKIKNYRTVYYTLSNWMDDSNRKVVTQGFIRIESGRIRHFPTAPAIWNAHGKNLLNSLELWKKYNENPIKYKQMKFLRKKMKNMLDNGKNVQIQGLGASIVNRACIAIAREFKRTGLDGYICAQVHDQIIVRIKDSEAKVGAKSVQHLMENTYKISIPLKAPAEIGNNFADAH